VADIGENAPPEAQVGAQIPELNWQQALLHHDDLQAVVCSMMRKPIAARVVVEKIMRISRRRRGGAARPFRQLSRERKLGTQLPVWVWRVFRFTRSKPFKTSVFMLEN
jgi:hypothetical protein